MSRATTSAVRDADATAKRPARAGCEPLTAQIASFVDLFIWLLVLKSYFLPLFIIPTGSMAETLRGAHVQTTCPNCGYAYAVGLLREATSREPEVIPEILQCPNCRWTQSPQGAEALRRRGSAVDGPCSWPLRSVPGDRIVVHGWPYDIGGPFAPQRWDVVVFKNPNEPQVNYIKRLIGLPGEKLEIIDGDIYINDAIARKTEEAQRSLWLPVYDHDYIPARPSVVGGGREIAFMPHWAPSPDSESAWRELTTRAPRFDGVQSPRLQLRYATFADPRYPAEIIDQYGYNAMGMTPTGISNDLRIATDVTIEAGDGYVELSLARYDHQFFAKLGADGKLTLEHLTRQRPNRKVWGEATIRMGRTLRLALCHADCRAWVEVDDRMVLESDPQVYGADPKEARNNSVRNPIERLPGAFVAAERVRARFAHMRVERDVHYTSGDFTDAHRRGNGVQGYPIQIGPDEYFVMGDNSPASADSRYWTAESLGPHLRLRLGSGAYHLGTVPGDQMIGKAFFVYWPGCLPVLQRGWPVLPDIGRVRWIH